MLSHVEYTVTVPVPAEVAFEAFLDLDRLLHRGIYTEASWIEGKPWQVGSRLRYVIVRPVETAISAVVTSITPPLTVSLLNHALGVTADQHVYFAPDLKGAVSVRMTMDLVGKSTVLSEKALHDAATFITKDALDSMAAHIRRSKSAAG